MRETYHTLKQGQSETLHNYHKRVVGVVEAMEAVRITLVDPCLLEQITSENGRTFAEATGADITDARNQAITMQFVHGADSRFDPYRNELAHAFLNNRDEYPRTLSEVIEGISKRSDAVTSHTTPSESVAFVTTVQEGNQSIRSTKAKFKDHIHMF
jgi:2-polyprenyl-6-methoxyphenol hydroxylase-like FAD-dependent oxidoreductase